ncbi:hypothetical protein FB45DRAFT_859846 [Roridomyces roridus]|uniref:Uncharacterized protein n=1 Tax=Roridomyces roridus TaxID=1738132 RepID=A0AAD7G2Y9_9AGAR|nr:hypothetical protein FB45DRAFT_859846 [Roridomyces roridus]
MLPIARLSTPSLISLNPGISDLSFTFDLTAKNLPWQMESSSGIPQPETQLHRIQHIVLRTTAPHTKYTVSTIRALLPWLARFPSLRRVWFDKAAVEWLWHDEHRELVD